MEALPDSICNNSDIAKAQTSTPRKRKVSEEEEQGKENDEEKITFEYGTLSRHSHTIVTAQCSANASPNCKKIVTTRYSGIMDTCENHEGNYVCLPCARTPAIKKRKNESLRTADIEKFELGSYSRSSHKRVRAYCELKIAEKCTREQVAEYRFILDVCELNDGKYVCLHCSRRLKYAGRGNPNTKYQFDDNFLENIDTEFKAYLLGWIGSDGTLPENGEITIAIHKKDCLLLEQLRNGICKTIELKEKKNTNLLSLTICSSTMSSHAAKWLGLNFEKGGSRKKDAIVQFPQLSSPELKWHFLRGYFDGDGCITFRVSKAENKTPRSSIASTSIEMKKAIKEFVNLPCTLGEKEIMWSSTASLILWHKMYANATIYLHRKHKLYVDNKGWRPRKQTEKLKKLLKQLDVLTST